MLDSAITSNNWVPCGSTNTTTPNVPCCISGDYCLEDGLCHYTHSENGGSGYYAAGCTDSTWKDKTACPQLCDDRMRKDVIWNTTDHLWNCCGQNPLNTNPDCSNPTDENFVAPAPSLLQTYWLAGSTATPSSSATAKPHAAGGAHRGLSTAAVAGVGVVCAIAGVAIVSALCWLLWRRRRATRGLAGSAAPYKFHPAEMATDANAWPPAELATAVAAVPRGAADDEPKDDEGRPPLQTEPMELPAEPVVRRRSGGAAVTPPQVVAERAEQPGQVGEGEVGVAVSPVSSSGAQRPDLPDSLRIRVPGSS